MQGANSSQPRKNPQSPPGADGCVPSGVVARSVECVKPATQASAPASAIPSPTSWLRPPRKDEYSTFALFGLSRIT